MTRCRQNFCQPLVRQVARRDLGGHYQRTDADMQAVWRTGVAETRELIASGWD